MKKLFALLIILLAACGPLIPAPGIEPTRAPASWPTIPEPATSPLPTEALPALPTPISGGGYPAAVFLAQAELAARLNLPAAQIVVKEINPTDWPDACLGAATAGQMCAQVITPGYEIVFMVGEAQYIYHTDADGKHLLQVGKPGPVRGGEKSMPLLEWTGANCEQLSVSTAAVFYGKCGETLLAAAELEGSAGAEPLKSRVKSFAPFEAGTPAGKLKFIGFDSKLISDGFGKSIASPADQRMLAEWAKLQFEIAQAGRTGAAWGLAFGYQREGGIAGFCDDVVVYLDGQAVVSNCKGLNATLSLTASEMQQVYGWYDDLKQIDYEYADAAVADAMKVTLNMPGQGQKIADEASLHAILEFASGLSAQASLKQQAGPQLAEAELALSDYFRALNSGDFAMAARLYGGSTDLLQTWNPDIKNDLPAWLELGCKNNGLVCMLPRSVRYYSPDARGGYQFLVEFNNPDGSLFAQGPCCGETSGPSTSRFMFTVLPVGGGWQVMDLPPYVP